MLRSSYDSDESEPFQDSGSEYRASTSESVTSTAGSEVVNEEMNNENLENRGRKKKRNPKNWQRNIRKAKRARGEAYVGTRGQEVAARQQGAACGCKKACFDKLSADKRLEIMVSFNALGDQEKQDSYLAHLISVDHKKKTRPRKLNPKNRTYSFKYKVSLHQLFVFFVPSFDKFVGEVAWF